MKTQTEDLRAESTIRREARTARDQRIAELSRQGSTSGRIALKLGMNSSTVLAILKRLPA